MNDVPYDIVMAFLASLTETEAGPDEWPEYAALLDVVDPGWRDS